MRHFAFRPALTIRGRTRKGLRGFAGKPLHPPLTDIPVAGYLFAATFDVLSVALRASHPAAAHQLFVAAGWTLLGGLAISLLAILTGAVDRSASSDPGTQARRTINAHALIMLDMTALVIVDLILRYTTYDNRASSPILLVVLSVVSGLGVGVGATYGGSLVFDYGFNVEPSGDHPVWHPSETDVFPADIH